MDLCLTGRMMDAPRRAFGLVSRVVPADKLMDEALGAAEKSHRCRSRRPRWPRSHQPRVRDTLSEGINVERNLFHATFALEDRAEGMAAFIEKRKPVNRNR